MLEKRCGGRTKVKQRSYSEDNGIFYNEGYGSRAYVLFARRV